MRKRICLLGRKKLGSLFFKKDQVMKKVFRSGLFFLSLSFFWGASLEAQPVPQSRTQIQMSFAPVVKKVAPAVVNIYAVRVVRSSVSPFANDPVFQHFFGDAFPFGQRAPRVQSSLGSGVLVRPNGVVITNNHVIANAAEIKVVFWDGREFEAEVVVRDKRTDLAALKLKTDKKNLPYMKLRDADELLVGDLVLALGNPFGLGHTVTSGIVSALARSQVGVSDFRSLIQTDAAINPGNSGGPLVTLDGRIVGINTAIYSKSGGSIGIGFAIPSNLVAPVIAAVDQGGVVKRAWLGIGMQDIQKDMLESLGLEKPKGVLVTKVYEKSPAARSGLKTGDIIIRLQDREILNESALRFRIATLKIGSKTDIVVLREGQEIKLKIALETPPDITGNQVVTLEEWRRHPLAGADVTGLSPAVANSLGVGFDEEGVVIVKIRRNSRADFAGFRSGDVILEVNGVKIKSIQDLQRNLGRKRTGWKIVYKRHGKKQSIVVRHW